MARIAAVSARRVDRIRMFLILLAVLPARAALASDAPPPVAATPAPLPKVEVQTVGAGPRFLTAIEERKLAAVSGTAVLRGGPATRQDATSLAFPWRLSLAEDKGPPMSTFIPIPGFAERTIPAKPFVATPNTAVEKKGAPAR
jgi:hypothetical protein